MAKSLRWSRFANRAGDYFCGTDDPVPTLGYIEQSIVISYDPKLYTDEDRKKAANICKSFGQVERGKRILRKENAKNIL